MLRLLLAAVFLTAAFFKVRDFGQFESSLNALNLLPQSLLPVVAISVVLLEIVAAPCLFVARLQTFALQTLSALCCVFISYSAWKWMQGIEAPCNCFGALFTLKPLQAIALNVFLLAVILRLLSQVQPASVAWRGQGREVMPSKVNS